MLQIQFFDEDIIKALVPVYSMKPDKVVFLYSGSRTDNARMNDISYAITHKYPDYVPDVEFVKADMLSLEDIKSRISEILEGNTDNDIVFDITGGTELMTACGVMVCIERGYKAVYVNRKRGYIFDVLTGQNVCGTVSLSIDDCINAIGAKHIADSHEIPPESEYDCICKMAEYIFEHIPAWHEFNEWAVAYFSQNYSLVFDAPHVTGNQQRILSRLAQCGFIVSLGGSRFRITKERYRDYIINYGIWLEMYVYIKAQGYFDEAYLGYVVDWNNNDAVENEDNEIDVIAIRKSVPVIISCKMAKPRPEAVYQVMGIAGKLADAGAKAVIATTFNVESTKDEQKDIYQRIRNMNVGLIETWQFGRRSAEDIFNKALQMAE